MGTMFKSNKCLIVILVSFLISGYFEEIKGQVCSPIGQLCTRSTDCCKGCCEAHTCIDRSFSCSTDMIAQPGYETCARFYCPPEHICILRDVCPPENPCPRAPICRKVDFANNYTDYRNYRNSAVSSFPLSSIWTATIMLIFIFPKI